MSPEAAAWDKEHVNSAKHHVIINGKFVPKNRPCDWCGKPVPVGYIHLEKCFEDETKFVLGKT